MVSLHNRRVLIIDDNEDIHRDFRHVLAPIPRAVSRSRLDELEAAILGEETPQQPTLPSFELTSAFQGAQGLSLVQQALKEGTPYAVAFVDMRMPPGWDGLETLTRLWQADPSLQAVLCSAYSDYSWESVQARLGQTDRLLILKKPFDPSEVRQMAWALLEKWNHSAASQRREQQLRRSEATLQTMLRMLPDALLRVGADGTCLDFKAPQHAPGSPWPSFPPGTKLSDAMPVDTARQLLARIHESLRDGTPRVLEYEQPADGETRRFESHIAAIDAEEALVLVRDITGHRSAVPPAAAEGTP
jgi:CheY-like chemotaxis protein